MKFTSKVLDRLHEKYGIGEDTGAAGGDAPLPKGYGQAPTVAEIATAVARDPLGAKLAAGDWQCAVDEGDGDKSPSAAFRKLVIRALHGGRGHVGPVVDYLLRTKWGQGAILGSRDPLKYVHAKWVASDVKRAIADGLGPTDPTSVFEPVPMPTESAKSPQPAAPSPITQQWGKGRGSSWFTNRPPPRRFLLRTPTGDGVLPLGIAASLSAEGGAGKTTALVALAVSVATGRDWLGHFKVDPATPRRSLLLLGEEDEEEVHRKLYNVGAALNLTMAERELVVANVVPVPLMGEVAPLLSLSDERPVPTEHLVTLKARLQADAGDGWGFIGIDPQSRFAGVDVEKDNALATVFVQHCESLTTAPGGPVALVLSHSSKIARRAGSADNRGVTGLTDGFRWHATLTVEKKSDRVTFEVRKSNYARKPAPLELVPAHGTGGLLFVENAAQRAEREAASDEATRAQEAVDDANLDRLVGLAVEKALQHPGLNKTALAALFPGKRQAKLDAIDRALARGQLEPRKQGGHAKLFATGGGG